MSDDERHLLQVCIDRYLADIRKACLEDQGTADGQPGTLGNEMQSRLTTLKETVRAL
jgi:hypothetical protein